MGQSTEQAADTGWLQITAGRCPVECQWVVSRFSDYLARKCTRDGVRVNVVERVEGDHPHVYKSVLLSLTGNLVRQCVQAHSGTILWHGQSPYRANHKRKNWYIGVQPIIISSLDEDDAFSIDEQDLQIETMRATGPGGQNVNRRETAVRVVHRPTGYTVVAREERSQWMNKKLAMARLYMQLSGLQSSERHQQQKKRWQQHNELERGNPIMKFSGSDFRKVDI